MPGALGAVVGAAAVGAATTVPSGPGLVEAASSVTVGADAAVAASGVAPFSAIVTRTAIDRDPSLLIATSVCVPSAACHRICA